MFPLPELFMKPYQFLSGHNVPEAQSVYLQMARYRDVNKFSTQNYCAVVASPLYSDSFDCLLDLWSGALIEKGNHITHLVCQWNTIFYSVEN